MESDAGADDLLLSSFAFRLQLPYSRTIPFTPIRHSNIHGTVLLDDFALIPPS